MIGMSCMAGHVANARIFAGCMVLSLAVAGCSPVATPESVTEAMSSPVAAHPDLNGIYFPAGFAQRTPRELPFTAGAAAMAEYWEANFRTEDEPGRFCIWPGVPRGVCSRGTADG